MSIAHMVFGGGYSLEATTHDRARLERVKDTRAHLAGFEEGRRHISEARQDIVYLAVGQGHPDNGRAL